MDNFDELMILESPDKADQGEYMVEYCGTVVGQETCVFFPVTVTACQVESIEFTSYFALVFYQIGSESVTGGKYDTVQTPNCGVPVSLEYSALPEGLVHNPTT